MLRSLRTMLVIWPSASKVSTRLGQIEIHGAAAGAARVQDQREVAHVAEVLGQRGVARRRFGVAFEHAR